MFKAIVAHISSFREWYIWSWLILALPFVLGNVDVFLNHGKPLPDYSSAIYSYALEGVPVLLAMIFAAIYSNYLNNSMTAAQYQLSSLKDKVVDNLPELIVFLVVLIHFHLHS